ncbi:MAG: hypothetical protein ABR582_01895 [Gemmatimonadaceae bacterium]
MMRQVEWTARAWIFSLPLGAFPGVVERVRGMPLRAAALVAGLDERLLNWRPPDGSWSVKEHLG